MQDPPKVLGMHHKILEHYMHCPSSGMFPVRLGHTNAIAHGLPPGWRLHWLGRDRRAILLPLPEGQSGEQAQERQAGIVHKIVLPGASASFRQ